MTLSRRPELWLRTRRIVGIVLVGFGLLVVLVPGTVEVSGRSIDCRRMALATVIAGPSPLLEPRARELCRTDAPYQVGGGVFIVVVGALLAVWRRRVDPSNPAPSTFPAPSGFPPPSAPPAPFALPSPPPSLPPPPSPSAPAWGWPTASPSPAPKREPARELRKQLRIFRGIGLVVALANIGRLTSHDDAEPFLFGLVGIVVLVMVVSVAVRFERARRVRSAERDGAMWTRGMTSLAQLRQVRRFAPALASSRSTLTNWGWIGVNIRIDADAITMTPIRYTLSRSNRRIPELSVPRREVVAVRMMRYRGQLPPGAILEFQLDNGDGWAVTASGYSRLRDGFARLGIAVEEIA